MFLLPLKKQKIAIFGDQVFPINYDTRIKKPAASDGCFELVVVIDS
jgi:hypothetical protein